MWSEGHSQEIVQTEVTGELQARQSFESSLSQEMASVLFCLFVCFQ